MGAWELGKTTKVPAHGEGPPQSLRVKEFKGLRGVWRRRRRRRRRNRSSNVLSTPDEEKGDYRFDDDTCVFNRYGNIVPWSDAHVSTELWNILLGILYARGGIHPDSIDDHFVHSYTSG